ncbi:NAD(P)-dependent oxidoreductase [Gammaproteobacteria bacterium]|jgi:nucleoside-diphosphate-sugar epimerase|nr:NAD(P)-dependent oxidoreductase [Gammaproteobacteria bacterium]MDB9947625.1 NAD(P)-dependent oxidoreductase [Gammaproteobacteria bacterium]
MIIAVTGASGSIGKELIPFLENEGHSIINISSSMPSDKKSIFSYQDLIDQSVNCHVDIFIHLASLNSNLNEANIKMEVRLTENILNSMKYLDCQKLIFFSTGKVYGDNAFALDIFSESSESKPSCPYSNAKKLCEDLILKRSSELDLNSIIFRMPPVINQSDSSNLGKLMKLSHRGFLIPLFIEGNHNQRSFISFSNIKTVIKHLIDNQEFFRDSKIYNLSDEGYISLNALLRISSKRKILVLPQIVSNFFFKIPFFRRFLLKLYGNFVMENTKLTRELGVKLNSTSQALSKIYK